MWSTKHEKLLIPQPGAPADQSVPASLPTPTGTSSAVSPLFNAEETFHNNNNTNGNENEEVQLTTALEGPPSPVESHVSQPTEIVVQSRRESNQFTDSLSAIRQQLNRSTVPEFLLHLPTMLVEYYFGYVCQIFSSFDGTLNPFRSTVGRLWDGSAPIYYAIQYVKMHRILAMSF